MNKPTNTSKFVDSQLILGRIRENKQKVTQAAFIVELFLEKPDVTNDEILHHMTAFWPLTGYADPQKVARRAHEDRRKFNKGDEFTYQKLVYGGVAPEVPAVDPDKPVKEPKFKSVSEVQARIAELEALRASMTDDDETDA